MVFVCADDSPKLTFVDDANTTTSCNRKNKPRLVQKCGELNINANKVPMHHRRLLSDIFNTILDIKWRWHVAIFLLSFAISWFFFAAIWYLIAYIHNDIDYKLPDGSFNNSNDKVRCVSGVHDFTSALLYSIETQHTIGYGHRHITEECPFAIVFLMIQSCVGMFVQGLVAGVVFAKLSRPNKRKRTIIFSNNAVITERDGKLCFLFKIGNIRISQLSDARIRLIMIKSRLTKEGEYIPFQSYECQVGQDWSGRDTIFFPYPKIVEHVIDENSPFFEVLMSNNESDDYEIVVILEGNIETTGASCHIRTSYIPEEILWGYRFIPSYPYVGNLGYSFDFSKFNLVEPVNANLFHLNRNNNFSKIFSKKSKLLTIPIFSFLKSPVPAAPTLKLPSKKSIETIFNSFSLPKAKTNDCMMDEITPMKNGRFTIIPVADDDDDNDGKRRQKTNESTVSTIVHFDEGYLTCKQSY